MTDPYLLSTPVIDWHHPAVGERARALAAHGGDPLAVAKACFEWVRDEIQHSGDYDLQPVTCTASEVLFHGSGYCYAKSHLLAALLRANGIAAGLCYQRLALDDAGTRFCLHGLNALRLPDGSWYRIDPRGNKPGVDAQFTPPDERLAFRPGLPGEAERPGVLADPLPVVIDALRAHRDARQLGRALPDLSD